MEKCELVPCEQRKHQQVAQYKHVCNTLKIGTHSTSLLRNSVAYVVTFT